MTAYLKVNLVLQGKCILKCIQINEENAHVEAGIVLKPTHQELLLSGTLKKCLIIQA